MTIQMNIKQPLPNLARAGGLCGRRPKGAIFSRQPSSLAEVLR